MSSMSEDVTHGHDLTYTIIDECRTTPAIDRIAQTLAHDFERRLDYVWLSSSVHRDSAFGVNPTSSREKNRVSVVVPRCFGSVADLCHAMQEE